MNTININDINQRPINGPSNSQTLSRINNDQTIRRGQSLNNPQTQIGQPIQSSHSVSPIK